MKRFIFALLIAFSLAGIVRADELDNVFKNPPESTKPWCYWYWISDNITKEGITKDIEAMARVGIGEAMIGNILEKQVPSGGVLVLSDPWWDCVTHAIREADKHGIKVGMFNCPGWSQSGGPWIKPEDAMRYVASAELKLTGPQKVEQKLETPKEHFQQIAVLAFPAPKADDDTIAKHAPKITTEPAVEGADKWFDDNLNTTSPMQPRPLTVNLEVEQPFTARSLLLYPAVDAISATCQLDYQDADGTWKSGHELIHLNRENTEVNVGPMPFGPVVASFPAITAKKFRLTFKDGGGKGQIAEMQLSAAPRIERFIEKQLGKMHPTPLPMWDTYLWPEPVQPEDAAMIVGEKQILDLSKFVDADGTLKWDVPEGEWIVQRYGMTPTGTKNAPAAPQGEGLEVDKMNSRPLNNHFDSYVGQIFKKMPANQRQGFRHMIADSYEMGSENWTDGFEEDFQKTYGYDPIRFLPTFTGRIVGSAEESERFLWDLRRLVADRVAKHYVGALKDIANKHGLRLWLENYGHWGFPAEFLQYGGASQDIGGEFWYGAGDLGSIECRAASSAGHIYGKQVISSEAFTSPYSFKQQPRDIKTRGDWAYCEGINHFVFHVNIHQPWDDKKPGVCAWFGTDFNRNSTWFEASKSWIEYCRRVHALLQQGNNIADVAYYIGDDAPKMTGLRKPMLPPGFSFDYINGDVIRDNLQARNGRLVLPHGTQYRILVLPDLKTMRPETLEKLVKLVRDGAVILGNPPEKSPSLKNYPKSDEQVKKLAAELWGDCDGTTKTERTFGKGRVFRGIDLVEAMKRLNLGPDLVCPNDVFWTHRQTKNADIYFLSNQQLENRTETLTFRVDGKQPELWNPVDGTVKVPAVYQAKNGVVELPMYLTPGESVFVVFRNRIGNFDPIQPSAMNEPTAVWTREPNNPYVLHTSQNGKYSVETVSGKKIEREVRNLPEAKEIDGAWTVKFDPDWGGPASIEFDRLVSWPEHSDSGVKYYSGTAVYEKKIDVPADFLGKNRKVLLELGEVYGMATVKLGGKEIATLWNPPYTLDVTKFVKPGENTLQIEVVNTWWNRLVGDEQPGVDKKFTFATTKIWNANSELLPAGVIGPVKLVVEQ